MEHIYELSVDECVDIMVEDYRYMATVREIPSNDTIIMTIPASRAMKLDISQNLLVNVIYFRQAGMYSFVAMLGKTIEIDGVPCIEVMMKSPISKYQRRDFIRIGAEVPIRVRRVAMLGEECASSTVEELEKQRLGVPRAFGPGETGYEFITADLSGGGVSFISNVQFELETVVECGLELSPGDITYIDAFVTRSSLYESGEKHDSGPAYFTCAQFINIDERVRRRIIKYVFNEQRKIHKQA